MEDVQFIDNWYRNQNSEESSERFKRLMKVGNTFYKASTTFGKPDVIEAKFIYIDKETGTYILSNGTHPRVNTYQVSWKSIIFNTDECCWFAHKQDALLAVRNKIKRDLLAVEDLLSELITQK